MRGYDQLARRLPRFLYRYLWSFEARIEDEVQALAQSLPPGACVLDAGAGEGRHRKYFSQARYLGVDLTIGDSSWNYHNLDVIADLCALPFANNTFDACLHIVTLEHLPEPQLALREISRTLRAGGRLLLVAPQDWQVHQAPHDYYRYTRHGLEYLLRSAGFGNIAMEAGGGYFRLMGRRMLNGFQFFPGVWKILAAPLLLLGFLFPLLDRLDSQRDFTLGYFCRATKQPS
ncbi:MAG: class I SAM-dependent methyltransferase [Bryobacteraceae bacterium]|nr:class I SAM-dependent methyltransferase [Bryobacteraceae bacterium]MDW8378319.1 class I SAM-dependent methyltransferase [Bryobacterales bacterium]